MTEVISKKEVDSDFISFCSTTKAPYNSFSNFHRANVIYDGFEYNSSEHAFQAQRVDRKFRHRFAKGGDLSNFDTLRKFSNIFFTVGNDDIGEKKIEYWSKKNTIGIVAKMATDIKRAARLNLTVNHLDDIEAIFMEILESKYTLNVGLRKLLMDTDNSLLVEFSSTAHERDEFFTGQIREEDGKYFLYSDNQMGYYLMRLREEFRVGKKIDWDEWVDENKFTRDKDLKILMNGASLAESEHFELSMIVAKQIRITYNQEKLIQSYLSYSNSTDNILGFNSKILFKGLKTVRGYKGRIRKMDINNLGNDALLRSIPLSLLSEDKIIDDCKVTNPHPICIDTNLFYTRLLKYYLGDDINPYSYQYHPKVCDVIENDIEILPNSCLSLLYIVMVADKYWDIDEAIEYADSVDPESTILVASLVAAKLKAFDQDKISFK